VSKDGRLENIAHGLRRWESETLVKALEARGEPSTVACTCSRCRHRRLTVE
jgi:hypothetical protein